MSVKVTLYKNQLVDMICGRFPPQCDGPYTKFTGNQWDPGWGWDRDKVAAEDEETLAVLCFGSDYKSPSELQCPLTKDPCDGLQCCLWTPEAGFCAFRDIGRGLATLADKMDTLIAGRKGWS